MKTENNQSTEYSKTVKLSDEDEVTTYCSFRVLLQGLTEESAVKREIADGKYVILQARNETDNWIPKPVFAFEVRNGNFSIISISGDRDLATLASEVWHSQFTDKHKKSALKKLKKLKKELNKIERDITIRIERDKVKT